MSASTAKKIERIFGADQELHLASTCNCNPRTRPSVGLWAWEVVETVMWVQNAAAVGSEGFEDRREMKGGGYGC